ncbi:hypothetical protein A33M_3590 [Rhodovulum sp. PH10]|uniref:hypothetical protein n=1 Tax=Rhodovulum sp. PH10 TaxID=1187851 RepID=UPI00027C2D12|nr:hypothetical protein [Rhodovulum sp. PH10]EJW11077.1 hypothetical protein A33M_3590 [Rhodovulum sp. PH10]
MAVRTLRPRGGLVSLVLAGAIAAFGLLAGGAAVARESDGSAKDFLSGIYRTYVGSSTAAAKGVRLDSADAVRRYFSHGLASVILEDGRDKLARGDGPVIGNDPFVGHDAWDIAKLAIDVKSVGPAKAVGTVSFENFGKPETVTVDLLKVGDDWRVAEITWGPLSLRGLYKTKWQAARTLASSAPTK